MIRTGGIQRDQSDLCARACVTHFSSCATSFSSFATMSSQGFYHIRQEHYLKSHAASLVISLIYWQPQTPSHAHNKKTVITNRILTFAMISLTCLFDN